MTKCLWFLCGLAALFSLPLSGQSDWGTIKGNVTDASGGAMAGVTVTVQTPSTGFHRSVVTNKEGFYVVPSVPIGSINLTFQISGFQVLTYSRVPLATGQIWTRDAELTIASQSKSVEVQAEATRINRENAEIGDVLGAKQVSEIPLNGRNWQGLLLLTPGAVNTGNGDARGIRFLGRGQDDNNIKLDGVDATGVRNQVPRDDIRLAIPLESIAEFRVRSGEYTAEAGGSMGAQVELVSRTGSNVFHGSLFEYFRNDKLDARSPFDPAKIPPFRLNQFGASVGGSIVKDKTFFFTSYEGLAQRLAPTLTGFVPTDSYRSRTVLANPAVAPIVNGYPVATGSTSSPDIGTWSGPGSQNNDQHSGMFRFDHRFTDRDLFFTRFNSTNMEATTPLLRDTSGQLGNNAKVSEHATTGVLSYQKVISPSLVNEGHAGVNRNPYGLHWTSPTIPQVTVAGFSTFPGARQSFANSTSFTYADTLTWIHGRHTVKAGFEMRRVKIATSVVVDASSISFQNPATLAAARFTSATVISPTTTRGILKNQFFGFMQDEFKISPTFSASLGLRYENFGVLHEEKNRAQPFDLATCGGYCLQGSPFTFPDNNNLGPRIGLAWAPRALDGRTVIRSGFGVFYGEGQIGNQLSPTENEAVRVQFNGALPSNVAFSDLLGVAFPSGVAVTTAPLNLERNRKDMYTSQWSLSVQQALSGGFIAEADYIGTKGSQLFERTYLNAIDPVTRVRPYPQFGLLPVRANGNDSTFQGMILSLRRQTSAGLTMAANYEWSHAIDNDTAGGDDADYPQNVGCRSCEKSNSDFDVRHNFTVNAVYELPVGPGKRFMNHGGFAAAVVGGWQLSALSTARTGRPITITVSRATGDLPDGNVTSPQRPNVVLNAIQTAAIQNASSWLNLAAFTVPQAGTWGNLGRNSVTGPDAFNVDASLTKRNRVTERTSLDFRFEVYNIANNPKFANPTANISAPATFGRITALANTGPTGSGTARQIEFAARLSF